MSVPPRTRKVEVVVTVSIICAEDQQDAIYEVAGAFTKQAEGLVTAAANTVIQLANHAAKLGDRPTPFFTEAIVNTMEAGEADREREQYAEAKSAAEQCFAHYHPEGNA